MFLEVFSILQYEYKTRRHENIETIMKSLSKDFYNKALIKLVKQIITVLNM
jgi:hypothetical protein